MKTKKQVKGALEDAAKSMEDMEFFDGEPDMYICQGWQEALTWVLGSRNIDTYRQYKPKKEKVK